jgi:hypothetical protein
MVTTRCQDVFIESWIVHTDSGPVLARWPVGGLRRTTGCIIDLGCRPASIGAQGLQPSILRLYMYEEGHSVVDVPCRDLRFLSDGCSDKGKSSLKDFVHSLLGLLARRIRR